MAQASLLLLALGALALGVGGAAADEEIEPNNSTAEATPLPLNTTATGNLTNASDRDFWRVNLSDPGGLQLFLQCSSPGCPSVRVTDENQSTVPLYIDDLSKFGGNYQARAYTAGPLWIELSMDHDGMWYYLAVHYWPGLGWEGLDEVEPNDMPQDATELSDLPQTVGGRAAGVYGDVDWWRVVINATGWVKVALVLDEHDVFWRTPFELDALIDNETALGVSTGNASLLLVRVSEGVPLYLRVNSSDYSLSYSIRIVLRLAIDEFSRGPAETEPNNLVADATLLSVNTTGEGILDAELDPADFYRILAARGSVVRISVDARDWWHVPRLSLTIGGLFVPLVYESGVDFSNNAIALFLVTNASEPIIVSLTAVVPEERYKIQLNITATTVLDDGELSLEEVDAVPEIGLWLAPADPPFPSFDAVNGDKVIFGESFCAYSNLTRQVSEIRLTVGRLLVPDDPTLARFVVARDALIPLYVDYPACFRAIVYNESRFVGDRRDRYHTDGVLEGDAASVMRAIAATNRTDGAAYVALWAVLYNLTEEGARDLGANTNQIRDARAMLDAAGVVVPLNAPAPPEAQPLPNPFRWDLATALAIFAAFGILITARFWGRIRSRPNDGAIRAMWGAREGAPRAAPRIVEPSAPEPPAPEPSAVEPPREPPRL